MFSKREGHSAWRQTIQPEGTAITSQRYTRWWCLVTSPYCAPVKTQGTPGTSPPQPPRRESTEDTGSFPKGPRNIGSFHKEQEHGHLPLRSPHTDGGRATTHALKAGGDSPVPLLGAAPSPRWDRGQGWYCSAPRRLSPSESPAQDSFCLIAVSVASRVRQTQFAALCCGRKRRRTASPPPFRGGWFTPREARREQRGGWGRSWACEEAAV